MKYWIILLLLMVIAPVGAQDTITITVPDDDVNSIAKQLYCPVCENIPLDACGTAACKDWREEIRMMLAEGMNTQEITEDFIRRFGERVVGTPQDPLLRALSLVTPWLITGLGAAGAAWMFVRRRRKITELTAPPGQKNEHRSTYRDLLEQDISG